METRLEDSDNFTSRWYCPAAFLSALGGNNLQHLCAHDLQDAFANLCCGFLAILWRIRVYLCAYEDTRDRRAVL